MKTNIKPFDVVALVENLSKRGLMIGQVGTVVEILDDGVFEVEFCDNNGKTYDCLALRTSQLMPLHYSPVLDSTVLSKAMPHTKSRNPSGLS